MRNKIVLIDSAYPINSRHRRVLDTISNNYDVEISVITWNRLSSEKGKEKYPYYYYNRPAPIGNRIKKLLLFWGFKRFVNKVIKTINPNFIIASHWDNLLLLTNKSIRGRYVIYENLDMPDLQGVAGSIVNYLEKRCLLNKTNLMVCASRFFPQQYSFFSKIEVLENKTTLNVPQFIYKPHQPLVISFIGGVRFLPIMKNLVNAIRNDERFILNIHGKGEDLEALMEYSVNTNNINFTGFYNYSDVMNFYIQSDVVWAVYPNDNYNVKYAISNKFHESIATGVPGIYAKGTCLGEFVAQNQLGFLVDPYNVNEIRDLFIKLYEGDLLIKTNCKLKDYSQSVTPWDLDLKRVYDPILS